MKTATRQRRRKHRSQVSEAMHLRVTEQDRVDLVAIAQRENRDLSETMRSLIKLGVASYWLTGNLFAIDVSATEQEPADELGKEQRHLVDEFARFSRALDKFNTKMQSLFKKEKNERRTEWQQAQNR